MAIISDFSLKSLPVAPEPPPEIFPSEHQQEQRRVSQDSDRARYTENVFQSNTPKEDKKNTNERFTPVRNGSFHSFGRSSMAGSSDNNSIQSQPSNDFAGQVQLQPKHVYKPLLDPDLQNDDDDDKSSDSDSDTDSYKSVAEEHNDIKQDLVEDIQVIENGSNLFQGEEIQPIIQSVGKNQVQTDLSTPLVAQTEVIQKQFTDGDSSDGDNIIKSKKASFINVKVICNKFTNKCYLAKTWLKVAFGKKPKRDDKSRTKWKSVDHVPATRLSEYENNRMSRSLETFTDYTANVNLVKETTPLEHGLRTPIYSSQATSEVDFSKSALLEPTAQMSPHLKDIMELCDEFFYGN